MNEAIRAAQEALDEQDQENAEKCMAYFRKYALLADSLLEGHPTWRLSRWISFARSHGTSPEEKTNMKKRQTAGDQVGASHRRLRRQNMERPYLGLLPAALGTFHAKPAFRQKSGYGCMGGKMGPFHWRKRRTCARRFAPSLPPGRPGGAPSSFFPEKKSRRINYRNLDVRDGSRRMELPGVARFFRRS